LLPDLNKHLAAVAESITAESLASILDSTMKRLISGTFESVTASEGSIWLHDTRQRSLVIAFNTGLNAGTLVAKFSQPLSAGIISMVFANEQGFVENHVSRNSQHDKTLDTKLHVRTESMIATPLYFLAACRGVISCVRLQQLDDSHEGRGFSEQDLVNVRHGAAILGRLMDEKILRTVVGLS